MGNLIKILVVEDEFLIAEDIRIQLEQLQYKVVVVSSYEQAVESLELLKIDLVILDIKLGGIKDGIDLAEYISTKYQLPYIFLSSLTSPDYIERAKKVHPYAYLIKPFNLREVRIAIELALVNYARDQREVTQNSEISEPEEILPVSDCLFLKKKDRFEKVSLSDIFYLEASSNYTTLVTDSGEFIYAHLLKSFEGKLPSSQFFRVHRSYIINIQMIDSFEGNSLFIQNKRIPVSQAYRPAIFKLLKTI